MCSNVAFRKVQNDLGLDEVYVLGTNCADNSPTPKAAQDFLEEGLQVSLIIDHSVGVRIFCFSFRNKSTLLSLYARLYLQFFNTVFNDHDHPHS